MLSIGTVPYILVGFFCPNESVSVQQKLNISSTFCIEGLYDGQRPGLGAVAIVRVTVAEPIYKSCPHSYREELLSTGHILKAPLSQAALVRCTLDRRSAVLVA